MSDVDGKLDNILGIGNPTDEDGETKHTPVRRRPPKPPVEYHEEADKDAEEDYRQVRGTLHSLIDKGDEALDNIMEIAQQSDHPRAYEVVSMILKNTGDLTDKLMQLQKDRQEVTGKKNKGNSDPAEGGQHVHFHGNTQDLMDEIEKRREKNGGG